MVWGTLKKGKYMKRVNIVRISLWSLSALLVCGCQSKSGNIWDDNQTGAKYKYGDNSSSLWENKEGEEVSGPIEEDFVPLNDEDLKMQFAEAGIAQPSHELGEGGVPGADQFETPTGELATVFHPVFFNTDQHTLSNKDYIQGVRKMAAYLKAHPKTFVIVEGHCDERGPEAYNQSLGSRRANYVRSLLVKEGASPDQLHTISYGKERPFDQGHGPDAWSQNRRAHFRVTTK